MPLAILFTVMLVPTDNTLQCGIIGTLHLQLNGRVFKTRKKIKKKMDSGEVSNNVSRLHFKNIFVNITWT